MDIEADVLGFKPQKEIIYNKFLPYGDKLDEESLNYLSEIKTNLGKALLYQDLRDISTWSLHLLRYLRLYGHKFSKEDHLKFVKIFFELLFIPDVELPFVVKMSGVLISLLKKVELLSRDDLILPWRPLYELCEKTIQSDLDADGLLILPYNFESTLKSLIHQCRKYFSVESTQEILDEFRPMICPFDFNADKAPFYLELFLCTTIPPSHHDKGFKLWFDELMQIWEIYTNNLCWEQGLLLLFSRLAKDNIGYINWEPYIPLIFTKLLRSLNLPGTTNNNNRGNNTFDVSAAVTLIVSCLGPNSTCQSHINQLFKSLESYYHPSNNGRWMTKLNRLLQKFPSSFINRLFRERRIIPTWLTPIPNEHKLTNENITQFVKSIVPVALLSMFSKRGPLDSSKALKDLAILRPELVIPSVVERLYSSLETLTEPHRLTAALNCVGSIAKTLVEKNKYFPEGPTHVIPLLMGSLPGIDPNDVKKCLITLHFIACFSSTLLLIDCSNAVNESSNLTELQQELCLATAAFEDFVLQFMDRCFAMIENSSLDNTRRLDRDTERTNPEEAYLDVGVHTAFYSILVHSSPEIFTAALHKLQAFVSSHIFEIRVSGKYAANMCRSATKVNPELGLQIFVPHFSKLVLALTESEDIVREEKLDDELLFSLLLLSEVVQCNGNYVLKYHTHLEKVLKRTLGLNCREGYKLASRLLSNILKAYTFVYTLDHCCVADAWTRYEKGKEHLYIEDWGKGGDLNNLNIKHHIPSDEEMNAAKSLLKNFMLDELEKLTAWTCQKQNLTRDEVQRSLNIILDCIIGAAGSLPKWSEEILQMRESLIPIFSNTVIECGIKDITLEGYENIRLHISTVMRQVLDHIFNFCEDDIKSLSYIVKIYHSILFNYGKMKDELDSRWKVFRVIKKSLENKLKGKKQHSRPLLIDRIYLQHELRITERNKSYFTKTHSLILKDLLKLSVSHYSQIRTEAQTVLQSCFNSFSSCYKVILPEIFELLQKDPILFHEEFKGILYVILGQRGSSLLLLSKWDITKQIWPLVVSSKHSEKPSIIRLLEKVSMTIQKSLQTWQIKLTISEKVLENAKYLWENHIPLPKEPCVDDNAIMQASQSLEARNKENENNYFGLIQNLIQLIKNGNLHWRHYHLAFNMLVVLIRYDIRFPKEGVEILTTHLIHDTLAIRKFALSGLAAIMQQQKRTHSKIEIDPLAQNKKVVSIHPLFKKDDLSNLPNNFWLQYNSTILPDTQEAWDSKHFVHKLYWGFYSWPKHFKVYAPDSQQPKLDRSYEELNEEEKPIFESFSQKSFVDKLISYYSLEEKKDHDKVDLKRLYMFARLFRNYGDTFLPNFLEHLKTLCEDKQESSQRCGMEILAGLISGSKHWDFVKMHNLKESVTPVFKIIINNVIPETLGDWVGCFMAMMQNKDANKYYWLYELFMEAPLKTETGSFIEASWLYLLLGLLNSQKWRIYELLHRILNYLESRLAYSYQNVREKIGSTLALIFLFDLPINLESLMLSPNRTDFINSIMSKLSILEEEKDITENEHINNNLTSDKESEEKKNAKNLFQTICRWLLSSYVKSFIPIPPEVFKVLPLLCLMQNETTDETLKKECSLAMTGMGQSLLCSESIEAAISILKKIVTNPSWHCRASAASFLQVMVFSNLFNIIQNEKWAQDTRQMILTLLEDERVEVREAAAATLGGFLHCEFLKINEELINLFKKKSLKKLKKTTQNGPQLSESVELRERHAGVLGLCAIVNAFPYEVPDFLPDILVLLGDHLHDPQPIETTIKKTLSSFRRTHHDNWRDHRLRFTDDQLAVITDLLVSPSYYA